MAAKPKKITEAGFRLDSGLFFPLISIDKFKQGDVPLIEAVTNTPWKKWLKLLLANGLDHALTKQGFLAVAIQRVNGTDADAVADFIRELPLFEGITLEVPDDPKPKADDDGPPTVPEGETAS